MMEAGSIIIAISNSMCYFSCCIFSHVISYVAPGLMRTIPQGTPAKLVCVPCESRRRYANHVFHIGRFSLLRPLLSKLASSQILVIVVSFGHSEEGVQEHEGDERMGCFSFWFLWCFLLLVCELLILHFVITRPVLYLILRIL